MRRFIGVSVLAALFMMGCGGDNASSVSDFNDQSPVVTDQPNGSLGTDLVANTLTGQSFLLQEALKDKPVVLWFWAPG